MIFQQKNLGRFLLGLSFIGILGFTGCYQRYIPDDPEVDGAAVEMLASQMNQNAETSNGNEAVVVKATGYADIIGTVKVEGDAASLLSKNSVLEINKDADMCAPDGATVRSQDYVISKENQLRDLLIFVNGYYPTPTATRSRKLKGMVDESQTAKVLGKLPPKLMDQKDCVYLTNVFAVVGTRSLELKNSDPKGHNVSSVTLGNRTIPANASIIQKLNKKSGLKAPEPVSCTIHPWMKSWFFAHRHGYFSVSDKQGAFKIAKVPTGVDLEFKLWHPAKEYTIKKITIGGKEYSLKKGRLKYKVPLNPAKKVQLDIVIAATDLQ